MNPVYVVVQLMEAVHNYHDMSVQHPVFFINTAMIYIGYHYKEQRGRHLRGNIEAPVQLTRPYINYILNSGYIKMISLETLLNYIDNTEVS